MLVLWAATSLQLLRQFTLDSYLISASENDSHNEDWRIIVCGVLGGAGISIASAVVVILLFLLRASKQKNDR